MEEVVKETPGLIKTLVEVKPELGALVLTLFVTLIIVFAFVIWVMKQQSAMFRLILEYGDKTTKVMTSVQNKIEALDRDCHQKISSREDGDVAQ
jgi:hypothetical protein